jgi:hypothetical protein
VSVLYKLESGGSGNGITDFLKRQQCGHAAVLAKVEPKSIARGNQLRGTIYHAFTEIYRTLGEKYDPSTVEFVSDMEMPSEFLEKRQEAERCFNAFQERYCSTFGGTVLGIEKSFELEGLTARLDALIQLPEENELKVPAGTYVVDDKCLSMFGPSDRAMYEYSPQAAWYRHVSGADGVVFLCCIATTKPRFEIVVAKPWAKAEVQALEARMRLPLVDERSYNCTTKYGNCKYMKQCLGKESEDGNS